MIKSLINIELAGFIWKYLQTLEKNIKFETETIQSAIDYPDFQVNSLVSEPYLDYLSTYSRNVISFEKPVRIDLDVNQESFSKLFELYIDDWEEKESQRRNLFIQTKKNFFPTVRVYFAENIEIANQTFQDLQLPVIMDLFGRNEHPVFARFIDLERRMDFIKSDYFDLTSLKIAIPDGYGFLFSAEPMKERYPTQHTIWHSFKKNSDFDFTDISEVERIRDYAKQHGVRPVENP
ncbi:MAG: hypothetical protein D4R67_06745 [Bacteroidetes bacterium]|nr:MAG: hypothetical protein D4R67_06745 [Bacteroidota bacterium]